MRPEAILHHETDGRFARLSSGSSLPGDLLASATFRLRCAALIYALGFVAVYGSTMLATPDFMSRETFAVELAMVGFSVLVAFAMFAIVVSGRLPAATALDVGLLFEVVGAFGISLVEHWGFFSGQDFKIFGISWICVWVILFPLIAPATPGKTLLAALVTATTGPIAYALSTAFYPGVPLPAEQLLRLFIPNYVCVVLAFVSARIVYDLGKKVRDARRLGAYELVEPLGHGGMGEVWRARHRFLSRPAAIKLIRPEVLTQGGGAVGESVRTRFEREAQATASLHSIHSIVLYDFGVTERGTFYYVMELLAGMDLQRLVERYGPLPATRAVSVLDQICHSLEDAHHAGLIHRDVKPANMYLCRLGREFDFVKVLDFGLVKRIDPSAEHGADLTRGGFCGTPGYIAPEIILGWNHGDVRSDVFSLGCVAYWLLTGVPAFEGSTPEEVIRRQIECRPAEFDRNGGPAVPLELQDVVMRCLSREPERRFASMTEIRADLSAMTLESAWTNEEARRWWNAHRPLESDEATLLTPR